MTDAFYKEQWEASEQFIMFLCTNMIMIGRYSFMSNFFVELEIDLQYQEDSLNNLPVSNLFLANIWRLSALCELKKFEHRRMYQDCGMDEDDISNNADECFLNECEIDDITRRL
jgi:hypothetical protein